MLLLSNTFVASLPIRKLKQNFNALFALACAWLHLLLHVNTAPGYRATRKDLVSLHLHLMHLVVVLDTQPSYNRKSVGAK